MLYIPLKNWTDSVSINWWALFSLYFPHFGTLKSVTIACYLFIIIRYCRIFHLFAIPTAPIRSGTPFLHADSDTNRP